LQISNKGCIFSLSCFSTSTLAFDTLHGFAPSFEVFGFNTRVFLNRLAHADASNTDMDTYGPDMVVLFRNLNP
jgi:hypothetical protein